MKMTNKKKKKNRITLQQIERKMHSTNEREKKKNTEGKNNQPFKIRKKKKTNKISNTTNK